MTHAPRWRGAAERSTRILSFRRAHMPARSVYEMRISTTLVQHATEIGSHRLYDDSMNSTVSSNGLRRIADNWPTARADCEGSDATMLERTIPNG